FGGSIFLDQASSEEGLVFRKIADDIIRGMTFTNKTRFHHGVAKGYFDMVVDRFLRQIVEAQRFDSVDRSAVRVRYYVVFMKYVEPRDAVVMEMGCNNGLYCELHLISQVID